MAEVVREAVSRSERLIESLLIFERSEAGLFERQPVDLGVVVRDVGRTLCPQCQEQEHRPS